MLQKFLANNCGDFIDLEEQFEVDDCYTDSRFTVSDSFVAGYGRESVEMAPLPPAGI